MNNEELILARLDELTQEVRDAKRAVAPFIDLKSTMEPIVRAAVSETINKLDELGSNVSTEALGDLVTATLVSSESLSESLQFLNGAMDLKHTMEPVMRQAMDEAIHTLDSVSHRFSLDDVGQLLRETMLNMGNLAEGLKTLSAAMEFKENMSDISKVMMSDVVERLDDFNQKGGFDGIGKLMEMVQGLAVGMSSVDLQEIKPIKRVFGILGALKRPDVQHGLAVALEMAAALGHLNNGTKPEGDKGEGV